MKKSKPILFATLGFPGSGKTYFAERFAKEFGVFHLNSDRLRLEIFPEPKYTAKETAAVFRTMSYVAEEVLSRGMSVIYDANSIKREQRQRLQQMTKRQKARYVLLWFKVPLGIALKRIQKRTEIKSALERMYHRPIDKWVLFRLKKYTEEPTKFEPYVIIDGEKPYSEQKQVVKKS